MQREDRCENFRLNAARCRASCEDCDANRTLASKILRRNRAAAQPRSCEVRRPKCDVRSAKCDVRRPTSEARSPKPEARSPKSEVRSAKSDADADADAEVRSLTFQVPTSPSEVPGERQPRGGAVSNGVEETKWTARWGIAAERVKSAKSKTQIRSAKSAKSSLALSFNLRNLRNLRFS